MRLSLWKRILSMASVSENGYDIYDESPAYDPKIVADGICSYLSSTHLGEVYRVEDASFPETGLINSDQKIYNIVMDCPLVDEVVASVSTPLPIGSYATMIRVEDAFRLPKPSLESLLPELHKRQIESMGSHISASG